MKTTFQKTDFNVDTQSEIKKYKDYYTERMPSNYTVYVEVSTTNGLSIYVSFYRVGETKLFEVRHSDHMNGFGNGIQDTMFSYKLNSLDLQPNESVVEQVLYFYGDKK